MSLIQALSKLEMALEKLVDAVEAQRLFIDHTKAENYGQTHFQVNKALWNARELLPVIPREKVKFETKNESRKPEKKEPKGPMNPD